MIKNVGVNHKNANKEPTKDANLGILSLIPARSHTFMDIDHEIISTVILLPSPSLFDKGCCQ